MDSMIASRQWATRPADERFETMHALGAYCRHQRQMSARRTIANRGLTVVPSVTDPLDIAVEVRRSDSAADREAMVPATLTHWSATQLGQLASVPMGYIRDSGMPGALAADCLNWGLHHHRAVEDVSVLFRKNGTMTLGAVNGPNYGTLWNADIVDEVIENIDGARWKVPGEFGKAVEVTKANTTLYASDRDMWFFLTDEENRIDIPNRRDGGTGSMARGFYIGNSEVGAARFTFGAFLLDFVCRNRIIWGMSDFHEVSFKHTSGAPFRFAEEARPLLRQLTQASAAPIAETVKAAQAKKIAGDIDTFLATRFGKGMAEKIQAAHMIDEARPIETIFDAVTGATAYARQLEYLDARVKIEREAGKLLQLAA